MSSKKARDSTVQGGKGQAGATFSEKSSLHMNAWKDEDFVITRSPVIINVRANSSSSPP
jgi:hypothetical protein